MLGKCKRPHKRSLQSIKEGAISWLLRRDLVIQGRHDLGLEFDRTAFDLGAAFEDILGKGAVLKPGGVYFYIQKCPHHG
jgi:hypothetical protein